LTMYLCPAQKACDLRICLVFNFLLYLPWRNEWRNDGMKEWMEMLTIVLSLCLFMI